MNPMHQMKDPAAGVAPQLLPHMHLISKYRYPITNNPSLETIVGYLLEAPKIVRDLQPVQWQFIEAPAEGTVLLVWQPLDYMGTNMASDGYVWGDAEQVAKSDVRGYTLEMYLHRSGYRAQGETMASHSRRRYRLTPSNPSLPAPDPSLFIVHYSKASSRDTLPAAQIPVMQVVAQQIQQRRMIQSQGQLARKDFMLHDRSNWPQIHAPPGLARAAAGQAGAVGHRRGPSVGQGEATLEEEEDVSRGDILDFMTPRDISRMRYEQHHEWMEEILESPYNIFQIVPGDLGLGRKGELEHLTKDFFDAPLTVLREASANAEPARVGKMDHDKADDFKKRATDKIARMQEELEKMRQTHARRMERLQRTTLLNSAEKKLRAAATPADGRTMSTGSVMEDEDPDALDDIAKEVESSTGKKIERVSTVNMISRGGLEERAINRTMSTSSAGRPLMSPVKAQASPSVSQSSMQQSMGQTGILNQPQPATESPTIPPLQQEQPASAEATPQDEDQDDNQDQSMAEEAFNAGNMTPADAGDEGEDGAELPGLDDMGMDVDMGGLDDEQPEEPTPTGEGNEWVMVDEQSEPKADDSNPQTSANNSIPHTSADNTPAMASDTESKPPTDSQQQEQQSTVEVAQQEREQEEEQKQGQEQGQEQAKDIIEEQPQDDQPLEFDVDVDDEFDTAGDALASYENDEDLNLDSMDDTFGDAFHQDHDDQEIS